MGAADWLAWTTLQKLPVTRFVSKPYERDKGKHDEKDDTPSQHRGSDNNKNDLEVNIKETNKYNSGNLIDSFDSKKMEVRDTSTSQEQLDLDFALAMSLQNTLFVSGKNKRKTME